MNKNNNSVKQWDLVDHYIKPLLPYLDMPGVTEILIDRFDKVYIEKNGHFEDTEISFKSNSQLETLIEQIGNALNQTVHKDNFPILDARLSAQGGRAGARINAVLTPVSTRGACMTIRVFPSKILEASDLLETGTFTQEMLEFLKLAMLCRSNIIVSGGTGSGKTTLINVLCSFIPSADRVITIEDTAELQISSPYLVSMEAPRRRVDKERDAHVINMSGLLQNALRQRPDRIIVGEIRSSDAAASFLQAINTGHEGCMTTLHANSTIDALSRMEGLAAGHNSGLPYEVIKDQVRGNIHLLIHQHRIPIHGRKIVEIAEMVDREPKLLWQWDYKEGKHILVTNIKNSNVFQIAKQYGISLF